MVTLRIIDFNGSIMTVNIDETPVEFNRRIDEAWKTRMYSIPVGTGFDRVDVRNIASITEVKNETPSTEPETPETQPTDPEQPEEPSEEPTVDEQEPIEPEPWEDN